MCGVWGDRDGVADAAQWLFSKTGFAGAVTLATQTPTSAVEHRLVFEYDLRALCLREPIDASLVFTVRGVTVSTFPNTVLHVYAYPADLVERADDFSAEPAEFVGAVTVQAMQAPTEVSLDVSSIIAAEASGGDGKVAFRFQIDPGMTGTIGQVFIDAADVEVGSKPMLEITGPDPGDSDGDGDLDLVDHAVLADCLSGPGLAPSPQASGLTGADCGCIADVNQDGDVDLQDLAQLMNAFGQ